MAKVSDNEILPSGDPSGWFDDVTFAVGFGSSPLVVAVCQNLHHAAELRQWLAEGIPAMTSLRVVELQAEAVHRIFREAEPSPTAWLIPDAAEGDDEQLRTRWHALNLARDRLRTALLVHPEVRQVLVFVVTVPRMPLIAAQAPDLLSVAELMTVDEEPFAANHTDSSLIETYRVVLRDMEQLYSISTDELQDRLFDRLPLPANLSQVDLNRWKAAAEVLRKL